MEAWMHYDRMLPEVFQQLGAYPFPFGSATLQWLSDASDAQLRRLSYPRLRDQAVSVDMVFEQWKGRYLACWAVAEQAGLTPYLDDQISQHARALCRMQAAQRRLRALLEEAPQPRQGGRN